MSKKYLIPIATIVSASQGDVEAVNKVLKNYEFYINKLASKHLIDDNGNDYFFVDETMKRDLQIKLIIALAEFELVQISLCA